MRTIAAAAVALVLLLAAPAAAHRHDAPPPATSANDGTADVVGDVLAHRATAWTMTAAVYAADMDRCRLDVQFGPAADVVRDGATTTTWSVEDPSQAGPLRAAGLASLTVTRDGATVRIAAAPAATASTAPTLVASR